jgi:plastocyanin
MHLIPRPWRLLTAGVLVAGALATSAISAPVHAQTTAVAIANFAFAPATITVPVGASITWTNADTAPHTATSDTNAFATAKLQKGDSGTITFATAGTFPYHCAVHPNMKGTVIVQAGVPLAAVPVYSGSIGHAVTHQTILAREINDAYRFTPGAVHVKVGTRVTWGNKSDAPHTVTSDTKGWKYNKVYRQTSSVHFVFNNTGTFKYHCAYHAGMVGTIIVGK